MWIGAVGSISGKESSLEIFTLGGLRILLDGERVTGLSSRKVEALLIYLAITNRPQPRESLAELLWDDFTQSKAMNNLRVVLSNLRKHFGDFLNITRDSVSINPRSQIQLDVHRLEYGLAAARIQNPESGLLTPKVAGGMEQAIALYGGEFLQGFYVRDARGFNEWLAVEKERLHRLVLDGLGKLVDWKLEQSEHMAGIELASRRMQLDPLVEATHRQMMLLLAHSGQQAAALRQYEELEKLLESELGVPPTAESTQLYQRIREGRLELPAKETVRAPAESPFKGMRFFDVEDAGLFFGREELTGKLVDKLHRQRFLAVVGASGSGKSSLVRAGLVAALKAPDTSLDGIQLPSENSGWGIHILTPTSHPLESLAASLTRDAESVTATATLMDDLAGDPRSLHLYARKLLSQTGQHRILIVVDQFEEVFTLCRAESERAAFINNLLFAVNEKSAGPTTVVITLRADFYAHCVKYDDLRQILETHQALIGQMDRKEMCRAIEGPAHQGGYEFEAGLVDLLLRDVGASEGTQPEPGALPLLSHALLETWKRRQGHTLTFAGYTDSGGVRGAIAQTAETVYSHRLKEDQLGIARGIFLRLTELGEGTQDTRRRARMEELSPSQGETHAVEEVLQILADARLVTTSEGIVEVAHETLIREWPRLRSWLDESREGLRLHRHLTEAAQGWLALGREPGELYRGTRLAQTQEWAQENQGLLNPLETEFLAESLASEMKVETEKEEQRLRERALERRRRRTLLGALIATSFLALTAVIFGYQFRQSALQSELQNRVTQARELSVHANETLDSDPELSLLLAIEAVNVTLIEDGFSSAEAEAALYRSLMNFTQGSVLPGRPVWETVHLTTFNPDGSQVLTVSAGGWSANLWDLNGNFQYGFGIPGGNFSSNLTSDAVEIFSSASFSPDGQFLLVAGRDTSAFLWDLLAVANNRSSTMDFFRFSGHTDWVHSATFSPDGSRILTASEDGTARLWDLEGKTIKILEGHTDAVIQGAISPDGNRILTGGRDHTARLWDLDGNLISVLEGHTLGIEWTVFSPSGELIVTAGQDEIPRLWDKVGNLVSTLEGHTDSISSIGFNPEGDRILSASRDGTARLWDTAGEMVTTLQGHTAGITWAVFSPDGVHILTASADRTTRFWNANGVHLKTLFGHQDQVNMVNFSPDGKAAVTSSQDRTARLWNIENIIPIVMNGHTDWVQAAIFHPDRNRVLTASFDGTARIWDFEGQTLQTLPTGQNPLFTAIFNPDGTRVLTGGSDGNALLWNEEGKLLAELTGHKGAIRDVAFSPNGEWILTASDDGTARLWQADGQFLNVLEGHLGTLRSATFSPDGGLVATAGFDGEVHLWELADAVRKGSDVIPIETLSGHIGRIESLHFSPEGKYIVSAGRDKTARLWELDADAFAGDKPATAIILEGHTDWVNDARFSPDGQTILTASADGTARLWDLEGNPVASLEGHTDAVLFVAFNRTGNRIVTTSRDGTARLWDRSGNFLFTFKGHTGPVVSAAFNADGTRLVTASQDGSAQLWNIWSDLDLMVAEAMESVSRSLSENECQVYLHLDACPGGR